MSILNFGPAAFSFTPTSTPVYTSLLPAGLDASFEADFAGWIFDPSSPTIWEASADAFAGSQALLITFNETNGYALSLYTSDYIPVVAGGLYYFSCSYKTTITDLTPLIIIGWFDETYTFISTTSVQMGLFSSYASILSPVTAPPSAVYASIGFSFASTSQLSGTIYLDNVDFSLRSSTPGGSTVTLPLTNNGCSIELNEVTWTSIPSNIFNSVITDGTGLIHFYNWPSTIDIASDPTLYDYGSLTITTAHMIVTLHSCKLLFKPSFDTGTYEQKTMDVSLNIRPHPSTLKVITIEDI